MNNHYHLIVRTPDQRLSKAMQQLNGGYSKTVNSIHGRSAHLFRNRFMAQLIDDDEYLLTACRYIAHNPVRAGLCDEPSGWRWSSYRASVGIQPAPRFLDEHLLGSVVGGGDGWRCRYREFVEVDGEVSAPVNFPKLGA
jgi:hypothetical protein